jgi:hypothetical protein
VARQFLTPYGVEMVEMRELQRVFIFDIGGPHTFREVFMDGRSHPKDFTPTYYGHSIGWWDGDTLVIDTAVSTKGSGWTATGCRTQPAAHHRALHAHRFQLDPLRAHRGRSRRLHFGVRRLR